MASCSCDVTLSNTGVPSCKPIADVAKKLIIVPLRDNSNNPNRIDVTSLPDNAGIIDLINEPDASKRYYPLPLIENVTNERGDPITEEFPSGKIAKIRDGVKTFSSEIINQDAQFAGQIEEFGCTDVGIFIVDAQGNLIGDGSNPAFLAPIAVDKDTWDVRTLDTSDTTIAKVLLSFQWSQSVSDSDIRLLLASDFAADVNWLAYNGLIDLQGGTPTAISTTGYTIPVATFAGSLANPVVAAGLAQADFEVFNKTQSSVVAITTLTESPAGTYSFTFTAQSSADVLSTRIASTTKGFSDTALRAVDVVIP